MSDRPLSSTGATDVCARCRFICFHGTRPSPLEILWTPTDFPLDQCTCGLHVENVQGVSVIADGSGLPVRSVKPSDMVERGSARSRSIGDELLQSILSPT